MVFVRVKRIYGKEYAYLVANSWTDRGARQKVSKYLGRVIRPEKAKSEGIRAFLGLTRDKALAEWIRSSSFKESAATLMKLELANHGISALASLAPLSTPYGELKINVAEAQFLDDKGKGIVFALNDGFLCNYTAKRLLEYDGAADYSGYELADALTAAGITVEKEAFISLFGKVQATAGMRKQDAPEEAAFKDFYY